MVTTVIISILSICFVLVSIALVHEFGHYITAKLSGVWVLEFAIGFGKRIWKKKIGETLYSFRPYPLGGFVRLAGMDNVEEETPEGEEPPEPDPDLPLVPVDHPKSFMSRPAWAKIIVMGAGAFMNMVWAIVLFISIYLIYGGPISDISIADAAKGKPAYEAGIRAGDRVTAINGVKITNWTKGIEFINQSAGKELVLDVVRVHPKAQTVTDGGVIPEDSSSNNGTTVIQTEEKLQFKVTPEGKEGKVGLIGIAVQPNNYDFKPMSFGEAVSSGWNDGIRMILQTVNGLVRMITRETKAEVAGPVKIMKMINDQASHGFDNLLYITAVLSINIGLLNILPFPVLDGGRIFFVLLGCVFGFINKIFKTKLEVNSDVEERIHFGGMIILLLLVLFVTYKDIASFF